MAKAWAKQFYKSAAWDHCREGFIQQRIQIDGGMCQRCGKQLGYIVHHKVWLDPKNIKDPVVSLNWENLEYVCKECHDTEHMPGSGGLLCGFDENGRPIDAGS